MNGVAIGSTNGNEVSRDGDSPSEKILALLDPRVQEALFPEEGVNVVRNLVFPGPEGLRGRIVRKVYSFDISEK